MDDLTSGRHLIFTGYVRADSASLLDDPDYLADLLHDTIAAVGMTILVPARMVRVPLDASKAEGEQDCGGVTGMAILSTSHVSIHTWPFHRRVSYDLYSCHDFDIMKVLDLLTDRLHLTGGEVISLTRSPRPDLREEFKVFSVGPDRQWVTSTSVAQ